MAILNKPTSKRCSVPTELPYTNRKGYRYYLHRVATKTGKSRYLFSRTPSKESFRKTPPGFRVVESVNGVVSLARAGASPITGNEVRIVQAVLGRDQRHARYAVEARKKALLVLEPIGGLDTAAAKELGLDAATAERYFERHVQYVPVLRFTLVDPAKREFLAERMCYRSRIDGWLSLNDVGTVLELARRYVPHLGKDSFYELF